MKRILVVDDDDHLRGILPDILSRRDRVVDTARDGIEAIALLGQHQYNVVLSDLRMPGLDGPALYETLRGMYRTTALPRVIFMIGNIAGESTPLFCKGIRNRFWRSPSMWTWFGTL